MQLPHQHGWYMQHTLQCSRGTLPCSGSSSTEYSVPPFAWDWRNGVCMVLTLFVSSLAATCGIGGGEFFVPAFNLLLGLSKSYHFLVMAGLNSPH